LSDLRPHRSRHVTALILIAVPASEQRPGDPEAGYRALVNEPYVACGIPHDAYRRVAPETASGDALPGREGRNAELPYSRDRPCERDGVEIVSKLPDCATPRGSRAS
jgi:hypothetical protein